MQSTSRAISVRLKRMKRVYCSSVNISNLNKKVLWTTRSKPNISDSFLIFTPYKQNSQRFLNSEFYVTLHSAVLKGWYYILWISKIPSSWKSCWLWAGLEMINDQCLRQNNKRCKQYLFLRTSKPLDILA